MIRRHVLWAVLLASMSVQLWAKAPDWISGSSEKFPSDRFLVGIGIAGNPDAARSAARAEIAKVFRSRVEQTSRDTQMERSIQEGRTKKVSSSISAQQDTQVSTDLVLEGVEIIEVWNDPKNKICYALAVLEKPKLRAALAQQMLDHEEIIKAQLSIAEKTASPIEAIRAYTLVLQAMDRKDDLAARKRVIDPVSMPELPSAMTTAQVLKNKDEALSKIEFVVKTEESALGEALAARITKLGFKVIPDVAAAGADSAVIVLESRVSTEPMERNHPQWKFCNWRTTVELYDGKLAARKIIASSLKEGQVSQLSEDGARAKALIAGHDNAAIVTEEQIRKYIFAE